MRAVKVIEDVKESKSWLAFEKMCELLSSHNDHRKCQIKLSQRGFFSFLKGCARRVLIKRNHKSLGKAIDQPKLHVVKAEKVHMNEEVTSRFWTTFTHDTVARR